MKTILSHIQSPKDMKNLSNPELEQLSTELRQTIWDTVAAKAGHLGASLGAVELTIALHYHYNTPDDVLVWDVGHQAYGHKLLTGRKNQFDTLRQLNGINGFPAMSESEYDAFGTGHSSTGISAITGMAQANKLKNEKRKHIAVVGDASIVSGMAFEALNHLGETDLDVLVILNDNNIGIDSSVGGLQHFFNQKSGEEIAHFFNAFGLHYHGKIDGHNLSELLSAFEILDKIKGPKLLHIKTVKGKGFSHSESDQIKWHAPGKFDKKTGEINPSKKKLSYHHVVGQTLQQLFSENVSLAAVTPAMLTGSGLMALKTQFPNRVWNVGIAEQHAVTFAAGLATKGLKPYCVIYSTFMQRAYDQVIHDVALQNLPVIFCVDRAGLVGQDGATHHGYFDLAFLSAIPNMTVAAPLNEVELQHLLYTAQFTETPFAIRYPRGETLKGKKVQSFQKMKIGKGIKKQKGEKIAVLSTGHIGNRIEAVIQENKLSIGWYHFPFVKPLDKNLLQKIAQEYSQIITFEEGVVHGGFGSSVQQFFAENHLYPKIKTYGYSDAFIPHGSTQELQNLIGLDKMGILERIKSYL